MKFSSCSAGFEAYRQIGHKSYCFRIYGKWHASNLTVHCWTSNREYPLHGKGYQPILEDRRILSVHQWEAICDDIVNLLTEQQEECPTCFDTGIRSECANCAMGVPHSEHDSNLPMLCDCEYGQQLMWQEECKQNV